MTLRPSHLLAAQMLGGSRGTVGKSPRPRTPVFQLGSAGNPSPVPTLVIAVVDDSPSVTGAGGTDPVSNRYAELRRAFREVSRAGVGQEYGAVVHFDVATALNVGPTRLTGQGVRRLQVGLRGTASSGTSELGPALSAATAMAEAHPGHHVTIVVFSDFALTDTRPAAVLEELAAFPGSVHAVTLGFVPAPTMFPPHVAVSPLPVSSPPGTVARALFASLVAERPGSLVAQS